MTRLVILDNSLVSLSGHSFNYDSAIVHACRRDSIDCLLFGTHQCESGLLEAIGGERVFRFSNTATIAADQQNIRQLNFLAQNTQFFSDLCQITGRLDAGDVLFLPTTTTNNLFGLYWYLTTFPASHFSRVNVFLRWDETSSLYMRMCLNALNSRPQTQFLCDTEPMIDLYRSIGIERIKKVPIPHSRLPVSEVGWPESLQAQRLRIQANRRLGRLTIGIFGEARVDKGFHLLPGLIALAHSIKLPVTFLVKTTTKVGGNTQRRDLIERAAKALYEMDARDEVILVDSALDNFQYGELLRLSDVVCLPYLKEYYVANSSGVMAEAIAEGKPVVVTQGTWLEVEAKRFGGGLVVASGSVESYVVALAQIVANFKSLEQASLSASRTFLEYHSADTLLREIIA